MIHVGIVGHRFLEAQATAFVEGQCLDILKKLQVAHKGIIAYSAIAEGSDSIFASVAVKLRIPLEIILPFAEYENDFINETSRQIYKQLKTAASKEIELSFNTRSEDAYVEAMRWILKKSDIVIAVWNGEKHGGRGGTADSVKNIMHTGLDWIHMDISNFSVNTYIKKKA